MQVRCRQSLRRHVKLPPPVRHAVPVPVRCQQAGEMVRRLPCERSLGGIPALGGIVVLIVGILVTFTLPQPSCVLRVVHRGFAGPCASKASARGGHLQRTSRPPSSADSSSGVGCIGSDAAQQQLLLLLSRLRRLLHRLLRPPSWGEFIFITEGTLGLSGEIHKRLRA